METKQCSRSVILALVVWFLTSCTSKSGLAVKSSDGGVVANPVVQTAALLPLINHTDDPAAPLVVGKALAEVFAARAPFK
ncbi:MAG: hypothetical protein HY692_07945, partial [Cyanobacteria bacterium NC_groundwater_1444_Ag_S-0.65um_54_12]|nr:hypothetical protein [Cyanobacteria bacterium NC_groundwater_1444_Ag_S-0.65um_54_12]